MVFGFNLSKRGEGKMKKITMFCVMLVALVCMSQVAQAIEGMSETLSTSGASSHEPSRVYGGFGFVEVGGSDELQVSDQEAAALSQHQLNGSSRTTHLRRLAKDVFVGYKLQCEGCAVELGYIGGDPSAMSTVTGTNHWVDQNGIAGTASFTYTQRSVVSAWHVSFLKEYALNQHVKVFGRIGLIATHTEWEQRQAYVFTCVGCINDGSYQGKSSSSDKTAGLLGLGLSANVAENLDIRFEAEKSSAIIAPKISAVFHF